MEGTIAQHDASQPMTGGTYEVVGGFWASVSCPADLDGNGVVDLGDLNLVLSVFGVGDAGDVNGDGLTNLVDLNQILASFGNPC
ncbi:MAG: hypothetical protein ACIAQF_08105 [Phycisphaerales bacterium JB065]